MTPINNEVFKYEKAPIFFSENIIICNLRKIFDLGQMLMYLFFHASTDFHYYGILDFKKFVK